MTRSLSLAITLLLLVITIAGCKSDSRPANSPGKAKSSGGNDQIDDDSLPIDDKELHELNSPDAKPNSDAERELELLRKYKLGLSLDEVRKINPTELKLSEPTNKLPNGELPEDQVVVEFKGPLNGFYYFQGTMEKIGKLIGVEVFTDNRSYKNGLGKERIRAFDKLLGKPLRLSKDDDDEGGFIYSADWQDGDRLIHYEDQPGWGSSLSLNPPE